MNAKMQKYECRKLPLNVFFSSPGLREASLYQTMLVTTLQSSPANLSTEGNLVLSKTTMVQQYLILSFSTLLAIS